MYLVKICFRLKFKYVDSVSFGKGVQPAECGGDLMQAGGEAHDKMHSGVHHSPGQTLFHQVRVLQLIEGPLVKEGLRNLGL